MTKLLRLIALPLLAALLAPALASAQAGELVVWHAYRADEKAALEKVVAQWNARGKGPKVTTLAVPYDAFADKISAAVPRGKGPDVFIYAQDRLGGWIEAGNTVEPIDFFLDDEVKKQFIPSTMQAMTYRGAVYGLPLNYKVVTLIYNKRLVPTPPKTTAELVQVARKLTDPAGGRYGLAYWYSDYYYHSALQNGFGGRVFDPGTKPVLDAPENVKAMELLQKWIFKDQILPKEPSTALITALFNGGKAGMVFSGPWFLGEISKDVDFALAPLPAISEAGGKPMRPWITVEGAYVAAPSSKKEAAFEFVKFLTSAEAGKVLALEGRQSPANQAVYQDAAVAKDPILQAFKAQVEVAIPMPNVPEMTMVWSPATIAIASIAKNAPIGPSLQKAQAAVVRDVANLRKR
jgi:arabinogalactan oligomer/maltooligosaccharide transport system substrate-binding protein